MGKIRRLTEQLANTHNFSFYSAIFRVYLCFHVIKKIYLSWGSISLISGEMIDAKTDLPPVFQFLTSITFSGVPLIYYLALMVAILYLFGAGKFVIAFCFHLICRVLSDINYLFSNGGDNILLFVSLYMIFVDSYQHLSINPTKKKTDSMSNFLSNLGGYAIMIHLCIIYFVSGLHKVHADVWFNGVATYYIMNLERYHSPINKFLFHNAFVIAGTTYFTLAFEIIFPILVWNKNAKVYCLIAGLLVHLGIYFTMMIYDFEILFIMTYGFFIANTTWEHLIKKYIYSRTERFGIFQLS